MSQQSQTKKYFNSNDARNLIKHYGFALFPIHGIVDAECTCGNKNCSNKGKHPATPNGFKDATKDIDALIKLWDKRKGLNVGIATGAISGIFVIDIDGEQGEADIARCGELPQTLTARTGRGRHLFFKHPGNNIKTHTRAIGDKVDVRGDGGYVAGPGSNHASGAVYEWENPLEEPATAPAWLITAITTETAIQPQVVSQVPYAPRLFVSNKWSEADAMDLLSHINPDIGYDEWIKVGMALQSEGFGFQVWDAWSSKGSKYQAQNMAGHWKSFKAGHGVSFGTLVKMAQDGGWKSGNKQTEIKQKQSLLGAEVETKIAEKNKIGLPYKTLRDIEKAIDTDDFVQGLFGNNQLSVTYGESNCGKTFFMTDLAFHVASGMAWRNKRVEQGGVIYAALEGSYGLRNRISAIKQHYTPSESTPFGLVTAQLDFLDPEGNITDFIDMINRASDEMESKIKLVVVDTLARALIGGDENSPKDMGMIVYHADAIRQATGAHVNFIHHSGKDKARGARGHSSLRAAVDTEIEINRDQDAQFSTMKIVKQREMEICKELAFKLNQVTLGINKYGESITSCIVMPHEIDAIDQKKMKRKGKSKEAYSVLLNAIIDDGYSSYSDKIPHGQKIVEEAVFRKALEMTGHLSDDPETARTQFNRIRKDLIDNGLAQVYDRKIWVC